MFHANSECGIVVTCRRSPGNEASMCVCGVLLCAVLTNKLNKVTFSKLTSYTVLQVDREQWLLFHTCLQYSTFPQGVAT